MRRIIASAFLVGFCLSGCAESDDTASQNAPEPAAQSTQDIGQQESGEGQDAPTEEGTPPDATGDDEELIRQTLISWDLEGGCEHMTDNFLEQQTFLDERDEACEQFEQSFVEKYYTEEDLVIDDIRINGDKATAVFGSTIADLTVTYSLVKQDGAWLIDSYDF